VPEFVGELYVPRFDSGLRGEAIATAESIHRADETVRYLRSSFLPEDETCFLFFEAASASDVLEAALRLDLKFDRIVEAETEWALREF
jgi:hypothetical protein